MLPEQTHTTETKPQETLLSKVAAFCRLAGLGIAIALVVMVIGAVRMIPAATWRGVYLGLDGLRVPLAITGTLCLTAVVAAFCLKLRWRTIGLTVVALGVSVGVGCYTLRIESFYGNLVPRLTWRWAPTAEERFVAYQASVEPSQQYVSTAPPVEASPFDHPGFLGRNRDGVVSSVRIDPDWGRTAPRLLWRHPVGLGWSGFAVVGRFAVTQEQREGNEAVVCYDLHTGNTVWQHEDPVRFQDEHGDGPRATPTIVQDCVYTLGGTGLLNCLELATGKLIWQQQALVDPSANNLLWGMAGSPLVIGDLVIVSPGGGEGRSLVAFDRRDGQLAWAQGNDQAAYASPMSASLAGRDQFLVFNGAGLRAYSPDGEPLWLYEWITQGEKQRVNVAQPVVVDDVSDENSRIGRVLISSGYSMGMSLIHVTHDGDHWTTHEQWHTTALKSKMSNFVVRSDHIYGLDSGILTCLNLETGQRAWKRGRYGHGQILLVDDLLLIQAEDGNVVLVDASPEGHREWASLPALDGKTWNHPALARNILVVRNDREAAAYELPLRSDFAAIE